jgi:hypothetical protein
MRKFKFSKKVADTPYEVSCLVAQMRAGKLSPVALMD